jgi:glycine oxidase
VGIAGGGLIGRLLGFELARRGWGVSLFDRGDAAGRGSCTYVGAGMVAPSCELESAGRAISAMGMRSLEAWPGILAALPQPVYCRCEGSLVVAHPDDRHDLERLARRVQAASPNPEFLRVLGADGIGEYEPALADRFRTGLYLSHEAHLDNRQVLTALAAALADAGGVLHFGAEVTGVFSREIVTRAGRHAFDRVADCRGMGAQADLPDLRGVRGEILHVRAPEVTFRRPVRLMHPRYPIYVVPREDHVYVIGATALESDDAGPISVRSALELLSAAYSLHTGFAEARILETAADCRPAFPDNHPRILSRDGLLRINGLYRHGFLLAPAVVQAAVARLEGRVPPDGTEAWLREETAGSPA